MWSTYRQRPTTGGHEVFDELYLPTTLARMPTTNADDVAVITFTSGTTGKPRGAELTAS